MPEALRTAHGRQTQIGAAQPLESCGCEDSERLAGLSTADEFRALAIVGNQRGEPLLEVRRRACSCALATRDHGRDRAEVVTEQRGEPVYLGLRQGRLPCRCS